MTAKEIMMKLMYKIGFSKSILSCNKGKFYSNVPGEVIGNLPLEEKESLKDLKAEDLNLTTDVPVAFFCDKYYNDKGSDDNFRQLKEKFDREVLKIPE